MTRVREARSVLEEGGLVVYPTETAYGIGCNALDEEAIEMIYDAKQRPREKGLTVVCSSLEQVERHAYLEPEERKIVEELMPGPLTLIVDRKPDVPEMLNSDFAFRISSSELCRELSRDFPVVATSANISGRPARYSVQEISAELIEKVDLVIDHGKLDTSPTSTVAELVDGDIHVHRKGPFSKQELEEVIA